MDRRVFLKKSGLLMGALGASSVIHPSILKAMNIKPIAGSTFYDAEHVVILMQENRSFDHLFGALKGVRGFKDKYAFRKADGKSVFFQADPQNNTYAPWHLDIKKTKSTWMSSLPHNWDNQQAPLNGGRYDRWLYAKRSGIRAYRDIPLTMGHYDRSDLPFYYQFANAFTVFDQYFCSSLTGTTPNRLFLWSGTIRAEKVGDAHPNTINSTVGYSRNVSWKTFPEVLEENDISWKIYQNEISLPKGMQGEQDPYLANFTDNPIEWFTQYGVKFSPKYRAYCQQKVDSITQKLQNNPDNADQLQRELNYYQNDLQNFSEEKWQQFPKFNQSLRGKAFTINSGDPDFWDLVDLPPVDNEAMFMPKGDILYQFRKDVDNGRLPAVSWLVAPERFSDHPSSQWYGAWYISEILNILTKNPEVWKKTIFILTYDENDGFFDHQVPFGPPDNPSQIPDVHGPQGIDYVDFRQTFFQTTKLFDSEKVEGVVGLGYRVPMVIASPWTTGGYVNSEVSDHTSIIKFLETFLSQKSGKKIFLDNMSDWRRAICGDLMSAFRQDRRKTKLPEFLSEQSHLEDINAALAMPLPKGYHVFSDSEQFITSEFFPKQESGLRRSNPLDYFYNVNLNEGFVVMENPGSKAVPLNLYNRMLMNQKEQFLFPYALYKGLKFSHPVDFSQPYNVEVHGPNGFYRNFSGTRKPDVRVNLEVQRNGDVLLTFSSENSELGQELQIQNSYTGEKLSLNFKGKKDLRIPSNKWGGWYDLMVFTAQNTWIFAGRAESGKVSSSDPHWA